MSTLHTVEQGESLASIAAQYGFMSSATIWDHPDNAELKQARENPNILLPGDQIHIPEKTAKIADAPAGKSSKFQITRDKLKLRLKLGELYNDAPADARAELRLDGQTKTLDIGDSGTVEFSITPHAVSAELVLIPAEQQEERLILPILVGHLDPVEEPTGQVARLNNLGYFAGATEDIDETLLASAVEEFQCDHGLTVDGICGPVTQKKLKEVHGC